MSEPTNPCDEVVSTDGIDVADPSRPERLKDRIYEAFGVTQEEVEALGPGSYQITSEMRKAWLDAVHADPILGPLLKVTSSDLDL